VCQFGFLFPLYKRFCILPSRLWSHPSILPLWWSRCLSVQVGCTRFIGAAYRIIDLYSPPFEGTGPGPGRRSPDLGGRARFWIPFSLPYFFALFLYFCRPSFSQRFPVQDRPGTPSPTSAILASSCFGGDLFPLATARIAWWLFASGFVTSPPTPNAMQQSSKQHTR